MRPRPFIGSPWNVSVVRFTGDAHGQSVKKLSRNAAVGVIKQYSDDSNEEYDDCYADRRTWNRQPADDSVTGFGGVHSIW